MATALFKVAFNQINKVKQLDIMLPCVCSVVDHRRCQNVVGTSVTYFTTIKSLSPFNIICHLLLNRCTATQNLLVHQNNAQAQCTCGLVYGHSPASPTSLLTEASDSLKVLTSSSMSSSSVSCFLTSFFTLASTSSLKSVT